MTAKTIANGQSQLKIIHVSYWKTQSEIRSSDRDRITENLKLKKFIKEVIPHYSDPDHLTLTLKTKSAYSESEMERFLTQNLSSCGATNISITRVS